MSPDGAISGRKRVFLGCYLGFLAPRQAGRPGEPRSGQSEAEFGAGLAFTYTHNREMGGGLPVCSLGPFLVKKGGVLGCFGGFSAPRQAGRPGEPRSDQSEAEFGAGLAFIYIHNRENKGVPLLVKKGAVFWGFSAPRQAGRPGKPRANQRLSLAQAWPLYIHTIERTEGCHFWSKKGLFFGVFRLQDKQDGKGAKQKGGPSELPMRSYPGAAYGVA